MFSWNSPASRKWWRKNRYWLIILVLLALLGGVAVSVKPAYRKFRNWRLNQQLEAAQDSLGKRDWQGARDLSKAVLLARGKDFDALRVYVLSQIELRDQQSFPVVFHLLQDARSTEAEKALARRFLVDLGPQSVAVAIIMARPEEERNSTDSRALLARILNVRGRHAAAFGLLRQIEDMKSYPLATFEMVRALTGIAGVENLHRARDLMLELLDTSPELGLEALALLGNFPAALAPDPSLEELSAKVDALPQARTRHRLLALEPQLEAVKADKAATTALIEEAIQKYQAVDDIALSSWLIRHGQAERAIGLLEVPAKTQTEAFVGRVTALIKAGKIEDATDAFKEVPEGADMLRVELVHALLERSLGNESAERAAWNRALRNAAFASGQNRFIEIARYATAVGAETAAVDGWVGAASLGFGPLPMSEELSFVFDALLRENRTSELLTICRVLSQFEPLNVALLNNVNYLGLLHATIPADTAASALGALVEKYPDVGALESGLAMARLGEGKADESLKILEKIGQEKDTACRRAMRATAWVALGREEEGRAALQQIEWRGMLRQEVLYLRGILIRTKVENLPLPETDIDHFAEDAESAPAWKRALRDMEETKKIEGLPGLPPLVQPMQHGLEEIPDLQQK